MMEIRDNWKEYDLLGGKSQNLRLKWQFEIANP